MQWRNPKYTMSGTIECEINDPVYGWIPFHAVAGDTGAAFDVDAMIAEITTAGGIAAYDGPSAVELARGRATIPREAFLLGCVAAGIITEAEAEEAADGSWPSSFNAFLAGMNGSQRIEAKALWASRSEVRRDSPLLALVAANKSVTDEQLDTLFGIGG